MQKINLIADSNFLEPLTLKENDVQNYVLEHWEIIFPHLQLIKEEFRLEVETSCKEKLDSASGEQIKRDSDGRVDILAFNPSKNCLVVIELKRSFDKNVLHQLVDYQQSIEHNFNMIYIKISQDLKFPLPLMREMSKNADLVVMQKDFSVSQLRSLNNQQVTLLRYELWKNAENICFVFEYLNNEPKFKPKALAKKAQELPKKPDLFAPPPVLAQSETIDDVIAKLKIELGKPAEIVKTDTDQAWWDSLTDQWKKLIKGNVLFKKYGVEEDIFKNNTFSNFYFPTILNQHLKKMGITGFSLDLDFDPKEIYDLEVFYARKYGIDNLEPIKRFSKLKKADFSENSITDLSPLKDLQNLFYLGLVWNNITDLSSIGDLKNLRSLWLYGNKISDLNPLTNLQYLTEIGFTAYGSMNLDSLLSPPSLKEVNISDYGNFKDTQNILAILEKKGVEIRKF